MNGKYCTVLMGLLVHCVISLHAQQITKVFHHRAPGDALEIGQIVLYFSQQPTLQVMPSSRTKNEVVYFFPNAAVTPGAYAMINAMKNMPGLYKVSIKEVGKPRGVTLSIAFDPVKVTPPQHESFVAITQDKGLVFRLYNKELLDRLDCHSTKSLLRIASANRAPRVIVDCGHGGSDTGAIGYVNFQKITEKEIAMNIGLELVDQLHKQGIEALLTRHDDETLALDQRTTFANTHLKGDLFISLHANWAANSTTCGIETFCLSPDLFNGTGKNSSTSLALCYLFEKRYEQSYKLAHYIHENILDTVKKKYADVIDRKVKYQVAQVLLGTQTHMPGVLVELGFVSNEREVYRLAKNKKYQQDLVGGLCNGITQFLQEIC